MKRDFNLSPEDYSPSARKCMVRILLIVIVAISIGCSAYLGSSDDSWTATFFKDPDRVWSAIELVLIDLDYEVVEENRTDGMVRAQSDPAEDGTVVALAIDQVMRTNDQVNVYVKPSFVGDAGSRNPDALKAAADEFVKALQSKV
ncbi:MAG: hypothetical protein P8127_06395 [Acidobacteriota bacterium]|jgi:hypothetical protein